ncbi:MAG TPA: hypothetical protein VI815_04645 [Candidatus Nanoarchaeia archaeon]|nr:hypothetical protein [Candidatus Nanoarchaeia archaeon]
MINYRTIDSLKYSLMPITPPNRPGDRRRKKIVPEDSDKDKAPVKVPYVPPYYDPRIRRERIRNPGFPPKIPDINYKYLISSDI